MWVVVAATVNLIRKIEPRVTDTCIIDLNKNAQKIAKNEGHQFLLTTIEKAKIEKFHFIVMLNLIEHVADPKSVLKKIHAVTDKDGYVLLKNSEYKQS